MLIKKKTLRRDKAVILAHELANIIRGRYKSTSWNSLSLPALESEWER